MHSPPKSGYLAGLDGWRALSIFAVMANHSRIFTIFGYSLRWLQAIGGLGVYVFFAISGLLICTRLIEEENVLGRINLRGFYIRRILRIQPAAILYLLAVAFVSIVGWFPQGWAYWFGSLFLYRNFQIDVTSFAVSTQGYLTGHFWTLAVEEHFYLLLSIFLFFVLRRRVVLLSVWLATAMLWPVFALHHFRAHVLAGAFRGTDVQLQYLLPAALFAVLLQDTRVKAWAVRWLHPLPIVTATIFMACVFAAYEHHFGMIAINVYLQKKGLNLIEWPDFFLRLFPIWIVATVLQPSSILTRALELPWLRWIGKISYSLYLWHVLFFRGPWPTSVTLPSSPLSLLTREPWNLVAAFTCATLSFYLVERPLMRLGHRLAPPATPGRLDMQTEPSLENEIGTPLSA